MSSRTVRVGLAAAFSLSVLLALGLVAGVGFNGLSSGARAYEYSTTITTTTTTTTSTSTSTTSTPTVTKPGKGCGDKNHLHERRFECKVVVFDVARKEGKAGTTSSFVFNVMLSGVAVDPVTLSYATVDGTAVADGDYTSTSSTLTFPAGSSAAAITVTVAGDNVKEPNESFSLDLSNASANAYFGDSHALGTILNDE